MEKKYSILYYIFACMLIMHGMSSCSDKSEAEDSINHEIASIPLTEWGLSITDFTSRMSDYKLLSSTNDCMFYTGEENNERTYAFQFHNGSLSASAIILPMTSLTSYVNKYNHMGFIGTKDVYANPTKNTIAVLYNEVDVKRNLSAIGFLPISSDAYEYIPTPEVVTNKAEILDYSTAEVSGFVKDLGSSDQCGIIFGKKADLSDGIKVKSEDGNSFSFTLNQIEMGKTYYYCAYVSGDGFTFYGQTLSFMIPTANISVTTGGAENITGYSASINGSASILLQYDADYNYGFFLSKSENPSKENHVIDVKADLVQNQQFKATLDDISGSTTYYYCAYVLCQGNYFYGSTRNFTTPKATKGKINGHEWVDLGLPSGTKWATCNVDATSPEICGGYFAWGETSTKGIYGSGNYPYGNTNSHSYNIPYNISGTIYDVARQKWGETWQMPTFSNIEELYKYCTFSWTTVNGVIGAKMTGQNGNSIFLPAGGGIGGGFTGSGGTTVVGKGVYGRYWSATMAYKQNWNEVKYMCFNESGFILTRKSLGTYEDMNSNGFNGMLIRPVTK